MPQHESVVAFLIVTKHLKSNKSNKSLIVIQDSIPAILDKCKS